MLTSPNPRRFRIVFFGNRPSMVDFNYPNPAEALADVSLFAAATSNFPRTGGLLKVHGKLLHRLTLDKWRGSSLRMSQVRGGVGKWHGTAWHVKAPSVESAHPWDAQIPTVRQTSLLYCLFGQFAADHLSPKHRLHIPQNLIAAEAVVGP